MSEIYINRTACPFCGRYLPTFEEAIAEWEPKVGTVGDVLTMDHFRALKDTIDHQSHVHLMEAKWAEMEAEARA